MTTHLTFRNASAAARRPELGNEAILLYSRAGEAYSEALEAAQKEVVPGPPKLGYITDKEVDELAGHRNATVG